MARRRLLRIKHDRRDLGFFATGVLEEDGRVGSWQLRLESPAEVEVFRDHLASGSSMSLTMVTRDGDHLRGEAAVSTVSDSFESATVVTLAGLGPLRAA